MPARRTKLLVWSDEADQLLAQALAAREAVEGPLPRQPNGEVNASEMVRWALARVVAYPPPKPAQEMSRGSVR